MKLLLTIWLFALHAGAKVPVAATCDQAFQNLGEEKVVARGEDKDQRFLSTTGQINYLKDAYLPELKKIQEAPQNLKACAREDVIGEFDRIFKGWTEFMKNANQRDHLLQQTETQVKTSPFFHDPKFAKKLSCLFQCPDPDKCLGKCRVGGYHEISQIFNLRDLANSCSDEGQITKFNPTEFESNFTKYVPVILKQQQVKLQLTKEMIAASRGLDRLIQPVAKQMRKFKADLNACVREPAELEKKMESFVTLIDSGAGNGTGFLVNSKSEVRLITAYHVFSYNSDLNFEDQKVELFFRQDFRNGKSVGKEHTFKVNKNNFNRLADLFDSEYAEERPALSLVSQGRLPTRGQKLFAFGFAGQSAKLQMIPCEFYGFIQASQGHGTRYALKCDAGGLRFNGLSGGPIVDETGMVWAVSTNTGTISSSHLIGSPVYQDEKRKFTAGLPKFEMSDLCVKPTNWSVLERCQLMENQYETQVP